MEMAFIFKTLRSQEIVSSWNWLISMWTYVLVSAGCHRERTMKLPDRFIRKVWPCPHFLFLEEKTSMFPIYDEAQD